MKILHLDSSVTGEKSVSRPLSQAAAEKLKAANPGAEYVYRDLVKNTLRHYTAVLRTFGDDLSQVTDQQKAEMETGKEILEEFLSSDLILIGCPMYNFGISSQLKAWVDLICVPGKTFTYGANGPEGLAGGKRVVVISSRGGLYGPGSPTQAYDHQEQYLRHVLGFLGITDITVITAEGVAYGPEKAAEAVAAAKQKIEQLA
ncbi:MAG TPA: NAD(P)H-dependent oxidoreductase [Acidobacteriaceae bacterium]|nr:NAD(P)H-dependent oxidoreductase [Acidobacteriaceae bacterium]